MGVSFGSVGGFADWWKLCTSLAPRCGKCLHGISRGSSRSAPLSQEDQGIPAPLREVRQTFVGVRFGYCERYPRPTLFLIGTDVSQNMAYAARPESFV